MNSKALAVAVLAAKQAGRIQQKYYHKNFRIRTKSSGFDLVTNADLACERAIVRTIKKHFPGHNFLAEENKYKKTNSDFTWIIDPLDGTNNFTFRLPIFCSSIALTYKGELKLGVVYDVSRNELFCAQKGKGSFLNKKRIKVSTAAQLNRSLLITGFYYSRGKEMKKALRDIEKFFRRHIRGLRRFGSAALDLCYIACGRATGFWEFKLSPWDFAAGKLIVEEAGGRVSGKSGEEVNIWRPGYIVASNSKIHSQMTKLLNS